MNLLSFRYFVRAPQVLDFILKCMRNLHWLCTVSHFIGEGGDAVIVLRDDSLGSDTWTTIMTVSPLTGEDYNRHTCFECRSKNGKLSLYLIKHHLMKTFGEVYV
jgi:hypothetical protein